MASKLDLAERWVLVTGASSGLGREIARVLARSHRANVVVTARRLDRLEALREELERDAGVECVAIAADLTDPGAVDALFADATRDRAIDAIVVNAGVTYYGAHGDASDAAVDAMLATNVHAAVRLTTRALAAFDRRGHDGGVLLVSSLAGEFGLPYQAAYSGTKAFVTRFGRALRTERRGHPGSITVFAPGGIATEMLDDSGLAKKFAPGSAGVMAAEACARAAVDALVARRGFVVPGLVNKLGYIASRLLPTACTQALLRRAYRL